MISQWGSQKLLQELVSHELIAHISLFTLFRSFKNIVKGINWWYKNTDLARKNIWNKFMIFGSDRKKWQNSAIQQKKVMSGLKHQIIYWMLFMWWPAKKQSKHFTSNCWESLFNSPCINVRSLTINCCFCSTRITFVLIQERHHFILRCYLVKILLVW